MGKRPTVPTSPAPSAASRCEYCHFPAALSEFPFHTDHIIAKKHGGTAEPRNLAFACFYCNTFIGPNIAGSDPESLEIVRLFHPREDEWGAHFEWAGPLLRGQTPVGRATIQVLCINHPDTVAVRESLLREGVLFA